jgi:hypothetical protein
MAFTSPVHYVMSLGPDSQVPSGLAYRLRNRRDHLKVLREPASKPRHQGGYVLSVNMADQTRVLTMYRNQLSILRGPQRLREAVGHRL